MQAPRLNCHLLGCTFTRTEVGKCGRLRLMFSWSRRPRCSWWRYVWQRKKYSAAGLSTRGGCAIDEGRLSRPSKSKESTVGCCRLFAPGSWSLFPSCTLRLIRRFQPIMHHVERIQKLIWTAKFLVEDHELHLRNIPGGGHRRPKYRSDDRIKKIDGLTVGSGFIIFANYSHLSKTDLVCAKLKVFITNAFPLTLQSIL